MAVSSIKDLTRGNGTPGTPGRTIINCSLAPSIAVSPLHHMQPYFPCTVPRSQRAPRLDFVNILCDGENFNFGPNPSETVSGIQHQDPHGRARETPTLCLLATPLRTFSMLNRQSHCPSLEKRDDGPQRRAGTTTFHLLRH